MWDLKWIDKSIHLRKSYKVQVRNLILERNYALVGLKWSSQNVNKKLKEAVYFCIYALF